MSLKNTVFIKELNFNYIVTSLQWIIKKLFLQLGVLQNLIFRIGIKIM